MAAPAPLPAWFDLTCRHCNAIIVPSDFPGEFLDAMGDSGDDDHDHDPEVPVVTTHKVYTSSFPGPRWMVRTNGVRLTDAFGTDLTFASESDAIDAANRFITTGD